ncbi:MAG: hypothetical protein NTX64_02045, partial [Elusimicrobia bacterium]|nr:hypothetical protein [Elusimicrobiota bacterium]
MLLSNGSARALLISELDDLDFTGDVSRYIFIEPPSAPGPGASLLITAGPANGSAKGGDVVIAGGNSTLTPGNVILSSAAGNVGIGTVSPQQKLDVAGNISFSQALMPNAVAGLTGQFLLSQGANTAPLWTNSFTSQVGFSSPGSLTMSGSSITLTGSGGVLTAASSVTASSFFGDGSHLTGLNPAGGSLTDDFFWLGNGSNLAQARQMSGDATMSDTGVVTIAAGAVNTGKLAADAVTSAKLISGAVQTAKLAADAVTTTAILNANVTNAKLAADVFSSPQTWSGPDTFTNQVNFAAPGSLTLSNSSITLTGSNGTVTSKSSVTASAFFGDGSHLTNVSASGGALADDNFWIGNGANVATPHPMSGDATMTNTGVVTIAAGAVDTGKLAADAVTTLKILNANVTNAKLNADVFSSNHSWSGTDNFTNQVGITGSLTPSHSSETLTGPNGFVTSASSVTASAFFGDGSHLTSVSASGGSLDTDKIWIGSTANTATPQPVYGDATLAVDGKITINPGAINSGKLAPDSVTNVSILNGSVDTNKLAPDAVTVASIADGSINTNKLATDAVITSKILNYNVTNIKLAPDVFSSTHTWSGSDTFTSEVNVTDGGSLTLTNSSVTLTGGNGTITSASSVTASSFFGDGSHMTNVSAAGGKLVQSQIWIGNNLDTAKAAYTWGDATLLY